MAQYLAVLDKARLAATDCGLTEKWSEAVIKRLLLLDAAPARIEDLEGQLTSAAEIAAGTSFLYDTKFIKRHPDLKRSAQYSTSKHPLITYRVADRDGDPDYQKSAQMEEEWRRKAYLTNLRLRIGEERYKRRDAIKEMDEIKLEICRTLRVEIDSPTIKLFWAQCASHVIAIQNWISNGSVGPKPKDRFKVRKQVSDAIEKE